jgi:hypothetical protein
MVGRIISKSHLYIGSYIILRIFSPLMLEFKDRGLTHEASDGIFGFGQSPISFSSQIE